ncbi:MAG TPA: type VII secretion protein EssC [Symbiobacteriaceae bacterium]
MAPYEPPVFPRSPRILPELPGGEVEIPAPVPAPAAPHASLTSVLMSILPGLAGPLLMYLFARPAGAKPSTYMFYSIPMMAIGALLQIGNLYAQRQKYERELAAREQRYQDLLKRHGQDLDRSRLQQQTALQGLDPDPAECLARVERLDARMWERSPRDADFLALRLGLGQVPLAVTVKAPRLEGAAEPDPLARQARGLADQFARVDGVPIRLALPEVGVAGLAGPRSSVLAAARSLALNIATHHSPDEVKLVALFPEQEADDWAWLRWLPHTWTDDQRVRLLAVEREGAHRLLTSLYDQLNRRKLQAGTQKESGTLPVFVFLLAAPQLLENEPLAPLLLREGPALAAFAVVLAERKELLPKECRSIVDLTGGGGLLLQTAPIRSQTTFSPDEVSGELAERLSRAMAPVRPGQMGAAAEIPGQVTLLDLLGAGRVEGLDVLNRWRQCEPYRSLAVPVGLRAGGERLLLDLHERGHGPHGLVAGATGAGKSELLQTLIASLAVAYHPHDVAFVMVDYKGGGMANAFKDLPHLVGTITNLEGNLARRALAALKAELKRRQKLLGEAGVNHIDAYMRARVEGRRLEPLPHLMVVVDEFAELKAEQPEFMRELISAVRVGRSLGVHLVLATQKPAGVVDEQIWSNTRFRLCLRVERPQDSQEVIKCPDAAFITGSGRAYFQVGNNERFELFQAGWGGAPYLPDAGNAGDAVRVFEVALEGARLPVGAASERPAAPAARQTELQALMTHLQAVAEQAAIAPLKGPWLPPLPQQVSLAELGPGGESWRTAGVEAGEGWATGGWLAPVIGLVDDPEHQVQEPLRISLARDGHLAIYGAPGSGKTTLVQTLVTSLARTYSPADVHIYLVDASGRTLSGFAGLPHVGGVILGDEAERVNRLLRFLLQELEGRKARFAGAGVNTLAAYRRARGEQLPAIVVIMDNYPAFAAAYPDGEEQVVPLVREGGNLGIHLVLTAASPAGIRSKVAANINMSVALQLADRSDYSTAVGRTGGLEPAPVPGRGLVKGNPPLEFQAALPILDETEWDRSAALRAYIGELERAWTGPRPAPVRVLPEVVSLSEVGFLSQVGSLSEVVETEATRLAVPVGLEVESLAPFAVDLQDGPHFLITGPVESGKTNLLRTWLLSLAAHLPPERLQLWLVDMGMGGLAPLRNLPQVRAYIADGTHAGGLLDEIAGELQDRRQAVEAARRTGDGRPGLPDGYPALVVAVDDFECFRDGVPAGIKERLEQIIRRERGLGLHLLVAGQSVAFNQGYDPLTKALKELQTGFLLGSSDQGDLAIFNLRLPMGEGGKLLPPGLGYYARRGRYRKVKAAIAGPLAEFLQKAQKGSECKT